MGARRAQADARGFRQLIASTLRPVLPRRELGEIVTRALDEDLGRGDVTTDALVPPELGGSAIVLAKEAGVLAGVGALLETFRQVDPAIEVEPLLQDGAEIAPGVTVARLRGPAASILKGERVALNLLQRMSGIATMTRRYVEAIAGTDAVVVDTRKTTPGLRALEKYAVRVGGGFNHRTNLSDGVLIKDNHLAAIRNQGGDIAEAVRRARQAAPHTIRVEIEVTSIEEAEQAVAARPDIILLDNMSPALMAEAVRRIGGRAIVEASGGIRLESVRAAAESGVNLISVGALTHSVPALDLSLELTLERV
jgi:nicotinate-nucleotide pyrophosphorylase (carboxylating)